MAPCSCQAPSEKAPPGQLSTDANQNLPAPQAAATRSAAEPVALRATERGVGAAAGSSVRLAFEIISCSLKGGQRGVCGSLEVKDSQLLSQLPVEPQIPSTRPQPASFPHPGGAWALRPAHGYLLEWHWKHVRSQARWTHPRAERAGDRPASVPSHRVGFCFLWVSLHPWLEQPPPRAAIAGPPLASGWLVESHLSQIHTDQSGSQTRGTHHALVRGKGELGVVVMRTESTLPGPSRRELSQEPGLAWKRPPALQAYSASLPVFCSSLNTRAHILTCTHTHVHMHVYTHT